MSAVSIFFHAFFSPYAFLLSFAINHLLKNLSQVKAANLCDRHCSIDMLLPREFFLRSILLIITTSNIQHAVFAKRFDITLKAPGNTSAPTSTKHVSINMFLFSGFCFDFAIEISPCPIYSNE